MKRRKSSLDRRTFVKTIPALGVASLTAPGFAQTPATSGQGAPQSPQRVTREMMRATEQLIGIELNEAQEAMALQGVNRNLANYEALRKIDIPLDTEPATRFKPALPGKKYNTRAAGPKGVRVEVPKYGVI